MSFKLGYQGRSLKRGGKSKGKKEGGPPKRKQQRPAIPLFRLLVSIA